MVAWLIAIHVFGFTLWVGGVLFAAILLSRSAGEISTEARQALLGAQRLAFRAMADPGALIAIVAGILLVRTNPRYFLNAGWLHIKLVFVLILILLHVVLALRGKSAATGRTIVDRGQARLFALFVVLVFISILIATVPGEVFLT